MGEVEKTITLLGFTIGEDDRPLLSLIQKTVENSIKIRANLREIPDELLPITDRRVVGEFLASKLASGTLKSENISLDPLVKSLQEGKVTITYETQGKSKEEILGQYINHMMTYGEREIVGFRKLRW